MLFGLAYPLQIENGGLKTCQDEECVKGQIISALETRPSERIMRQDYGTPNNIFSALVPAVITSDIERALQDTTDATQIKVEYSRDSSAYERGELDIKVSFSYDDRQQSISLTVQDEA